MPKAKPLNTDTLQHYSRRIRQIPPDRRPLWGSMNVAENFAHNSRYFELVLEQRTTEDRSNWLFRTLVKPLMLGPMTFPRNVSTIPELSVASTEDAEAERKRLLSLMQEFCRRAEESPEHEVRNPLLGPLKLKQWAILAGKHLDHHLRQFGE
jgi:hypothetical protein